MPVARPRYILNPSTSVIGGCAPYYVAGSSYTRANHVGKTIKKWPRTPSVSEPPCSLDRSREQLGMQRDHVGGKPG